MYVIKSLHIVHLHSGICSSEHIQYLSNIIRYMIESSIVVILKFGTTFVCSKYSIDIIIGILEIHLILPNHFFCSLDKQG